MTPALHPQRGASVPSTSPGLTSKETSFDTFGTFGRSLEGPDGLVGDGLRPVSTQGRGQAAKGSGDGAGQGVAQGAVARLGGADAVALGDPSTALPSTMLRTGRTWVFDADGDVGHRYLKSRSAILLV